MNHTFTKQLLFLIFMSGIVLQSYGSRTLTIRPIVSTQDSVLRIKDFVMNDHLLNDREREFELMETPTDKDKLLSLVDLAYLFQQYEEMMDVRVSGPRKIRIRHTRDHAHLEKIKQAILAGVKKIAPWKEWEIDMLFSSTDEMTLSKIDDFEMVEVLPYDNSTMLGNIQFKTTFFDAKGRETGSGNITPVILKKVDVAVIDSNAAKGHILSPSDVKMVPVWVGGNKKDYIEDATICHGRELAKSLSAGDIIHNRDLLNPICCRRGDLVRIESRHGGLSVKIIAMALETGRKGDFVKFENRSSKKVFSARLTGIKEALFEKN